MLGLKVETDAVWVEEAMRDLEQLDLEFILADLAMDVLVPPLTWLVLSIVLGCTVSVAFALFAPNGAGARSLVWIPWVASLLFVMSYVGRGVVLAGVGMAGVRDLLWAPAYMAWKVILTVRQRGQKKDLWVRTTREKAP